MKKSIKKLETKVVKNTKTIKGGSLGGDSIVIDVEEMSFGSSHK